MIDALNELLEEWGNDRDTMIADRRETEAEILDSCIEQLEMLIGESDE